MKTVLNREQNSSAAKGAFIWSLTLLFFAAAALLLLLLGRGALVSVEGENAEGALLFLGGNLPPDAGPRFLSSALLRGSLLLFGVSEFALRLPSAAAALLLLAGSVVLAARVVGKKGAILTGWMLLGSYGFLYWGRSAAGAIFPAVWVVWAAVLGNWREKSFSFLRCFFAGLLLFSSFFFLNNLAFLFILLLWIPEWCSRDVWRRQGKLAGFFGFVFAFLMTAAAVYSLLRWQLGRELPDLWAMLSQEGSHPIAKWIRRQSGGFSLSMLLHLPRLLLPWPLFTVVAIAEIIRHRSRMDGAVFRIALSVILMFLFAGIWPMRRWGTLLPLLPFLLILTGAGLDCRLGCRLVPGLTDRTMRLILMVTASLLTVFPVSWPLWDILLMQHPASYVMVILPLLGLLALAFLNGEYLPRCKTGMRQVLPSRYAGSVLAGATVMTALLCVLQPGLTPFRTGIRFLAAVREKMAEEKVSGICFFRDRPGSPYLFYLNRSDRPRFLQNEEELERFLRNTQEKKILMIARQRRENGSAVAKASGNAGWDVSQKPDISEDFPLRLSRQRGDAEPDPAELFGAWILIKTK